MLAELALLALTRTAPALRRLGLASDAVRLWARRRRCAAAWAAHEAQCHKLVERAIEGLPARRKALILGSGLVRDVPIDGLAARFETVLLVDAVHLPVTRRRLARHHNLVFVTADLSGVGHWLAGKAAGREDPMAPFVADGVIDLVVSANLLSQLPLGPEAWAEAHPARTPMPPAELARAVIDWHLADLRRFDARVCLLTDTIQREVRRDGTLVEVQDLLHGATLPPPDAVWDWTVAPFGEAARDTALIHAVSGYADFR